MTTTARGGLVDRLRDVAGAAGGLPQLAADVCAAVDRHVSFDFGCFATTDPATGVITWAWKTRSLGVGDEEFAAAEYGPPDINGLAEIARRRPPVGVLSIDTGGLPDTCRRHREFMSPRFGFTDELRVVFVSRAVSWGALALYRGENGARFTARDADELGAVSELVAEAIQHRLFCVDRDPRRRDPSPSPAVADGPAVLIIDTADRVTQLTPAASAAIDELGGWEHGSLPANVLAVVATTRTHSEPSDTHVRGRSGRWLSLRASVLTGPPGSRDVVVTVDPTPRAALSRLALTAHGLTAREEEVALLVLHGADTRAIATALYLSPHTVQDHLKAIFTKLDVTSRREMTARLVLD
jgi:DNA-binding CsgD family transcriptional regulator